MRSFATSNQKTQLKKTDSAKEPKKTTKQSKLNESSIADPARQLPNEASDLVANNDETWKERLRNTKGDIEFIKGKEANLKQDRNYQLLISDTHEQV